MRPPIILDLRSVDSWAKGESAALCHEVPGLKGNGYLVYSSPWGQCEMTSDVEAVMLQFPHFFDLANWEDWQELQVRKSELARHMSELENQIHDLRSRPTFKAYITQLSVSAPGEEAPQPPEEFVLLDRERQIVQQSRATNQQNRIEFLRESPISPQVNIEFRFQTLDYRVIDLLKTHWRVRQPPSMLSRAYIRVVLISLEEWNYAKGGN